MLGVLCALVVAVAGGCRETRKPLKYVGNEPLRYYEDVALRITPPDVEVVVPDVPQAPHRLSAPNADDIWDLTLAEAIRIALENAAIVRSDEQFLNRGNVISGNPNFAPSVFDPALQQAGFRFGNRGVEAALADFDTRFTTNMLWGRSELVQNSLVLSGGLPPGSTLTDETGNFTSRLEKRLGNGGTLGFQHDWNYSLNNRPGQLFGSAYNGFLRADYRHPLWAGAGVEYTRIAGPTLGDGQVNVDQGVVIARINEDVTLADFEEDVRNLLRDVEELYWNLALAYHVYDSEVVARNAALQTWRPENAKLDLPPELPTLTSSGNEAQARDQYFEARARAENALADLYEAETRLRRLLGLTVNDGRVIRPSDEPITAEVELDWEASLVSALTRRVELRRQKWRIKSLDLQHRAARNLVNPRLDFVSTYQRNGFGDDLLAGSDDDGITTQGFANAYETLSQGSHDSWTLGFEFSVPLGQRLAHTRVRNIELQLAKARAGLAVLELEIGHELAIAFQQIDRFRATARSNYSRMKAAIEREKVFQVRYKAGRDPTNDQLLRSQTSVAAAKTAYYQSLVQYNQAIAELHLRSGTLLEQDRVFLAESAWGPKAYKLAMRRAVARSHALKASKLLHTEPHEFAPSIPIAPAGWDKPVDDGADQPELPEPEIGPAEIEGGGPDAVEEAPSVQSEQPAILPVESTRPKKRVGMRKPVELLEWLDVESDAATTIDP